MTIPDLILFYLGVTRDELKSNSKAKQIANVRAVWSFLMYELTTMSYPQIARKIDKDPSTILKAARRVRENPALLASAVDVVGKIDPATRQIVQRTPGTTDADVPRGGA